MTLVDNGQISRNDIENKLLAWKSLEGSEIICLRSIAFEQSRRYSNFVAS